MSRVSKAKPSVAPCRTILIPLISFCLCVGSAAASGQTSKSGTSSGAPLTLKQAIAMALSHSPAVGQARANLEAREEKTVQSWLDLGPKVNADYNQVFFEDEQTMNFGGQEVTIRPEETRTASITASQPLTDLFALVEKARYEGIREDGEAARYAMVRSQIAFQVAEAFLNLNRAEALLKVAREGQSASEKQAKDAEALYRAGRIHKGDLLKLQLALSNARLSLAQAEAAHTSASAAMHALLGIDQSRPMALAKQELFPVEPVSGQSHDVSRRPDVQAAKIGAEAAGFGKELAAAGFMPSIRAFAKVDHNLLEPSGFGGGGKVTRTYGIAATWMLWNNGSRVFQYREAASRAQAAEAGFEAARDQAESEITIARARLKAAAEARHLAKTTLEQARESYRIEAARFNTGASGATDLVLAEAARTAAEGGMISAATDYKISIMKLQQALGYETPKLQEKAR